MRKDLVRFDVGKRLGLAAALSVLLLIGAVTVAGAETITLPSDASGNTIDNVPNFGKVYVPGGNTPIFSDNTVNVNGTVNDGHIAGGGNFNGDATGNAVNIVSGASMSNNFMVIGGVSAGGTVRENTVEVTAGTIAANILGGVSLSGGDALTNYVKIKGGSVSGEIIGGYATGRGNADGNIVTIESNITSSKRTIGGVSDTGNSTNNRVTIRSGTVAITDEDIIGGTSWGAAAGQEASNKGNVKNNTVEIIGNANVTARNIFGGHMRGTGTNSDNTVTVDTTGTVTVADWGVVGGFSQDNGGNVQDNAVNIVKGTINGKVIGGLAITNGAAEGNKVNFHSGTVKGVIIGGKSHGGNAQDNTVTIQAGGTVEGVHQLSDTTYASVIGGFVDSQSSGGDGNATGNTVTNDGTVKGGDIYGGVVLGGTGSASHNTVTNTGKVETTPVGGKADIIGGYVGRSGTGDASYNTVYFLDGTTWDIKGGRVSGNQGGKADFNKVIISEGTVIGNVYGGHTDGKSSASNNIVEIHGGELKSNIIGGSVTTGGKAINNIILLTGSPKFNEDITRLSGGQNGYNGETHEDAFRGNTLKVYNYSGSGVQDIRNFQFFEFILPGTIAANTPVLQTNFITLGTQKGAEVKSEVKSLAIDGGGQALNSGDKIILIASNNTPSGAGLETRTLPGSQGATLSYNFLTRLEGNNIIAEVDGNPSASPEAKSLSEGHLSGVALVNQGADLAVDKGIAVAVRNALNPGLQAFGTFGGGSLRYNTGSHVDVDGFSFLAGLGFGAQLAPGRVTLGAFFEYGQGEYNTHNSFASGSVRGSGDTEYIGGGILGRFDFADTGPGHFYAEATGRMGSVTADYSSSQLTDNRGVKASYDTESLYYGLHFGTGYVWNITNAASLDVYGKYLWTHQDGDSIRLSTGDPVKFDDVDSHRLRGGGRFAYAVNEFVSPYIGAAYEHEFDGKAKASTYGYAIDSPDMTGGTGIGEVGLTVKTGSIVSFDLGAQGYTGAREGVTGSLQLKIEF
ncbi:MAG: autotransporter domain-containing protein [Desulfovibrio sp.]|jgi:hypothetical protein|nr:autotransporter domain-containing protein [Desulfovibrio sp.]